MNHLKLLIAISVIFVTVGCNNATTTANTSDTADTSKKIETQATAASAYQQTIDGKKVALFILKNKNSMQASRCRGSCLHEPPTI